MKTTYTSEEKIKYFNELLEREEHKLMLLEARSLLAMDRIDRLKKVLADLIAKAK